MIIIFTIPATLLQMIKNILRGSLALYDWWAQSLWDPAPIPKPDTTVVNNTVMETNIKLVIVIFLWNIRGLKLIKMGCSKKNNFDFRVLKQDAGEWKSY